LQIHILNARDKLRIALNSLQTGHPVKKGVWVFQSCMPSYVFPDSTHNTHRAFEDVIVMEQIFTASSLALVLSELTIRGVEKLAQTWTLQVQTFKRVSKLLLKFKQATTKCMAKRLDEYMFEQYKSNYEY